MSKKPQAVSAMQDRIMKQFRAAVPLVVADQQHGGIQA